ncbi:MAG: hypothetical protein FJ095_01980 [Deltaproteobacteria bacterium]|nr:hypothetical protein [Deltaproteobacteria bacterium]
MATKKQANKGKQHDKHEHGEAASEAHDHGHGQGDHGHHDEAEDDEAESRADDPTWWAPHAVLVTLLFFGIGSMMGLFNKWLVPLVTGGHAAHASADHGSHGADAHKPTQPPSAKPAAAPAKGAH